MYEYICGKQNANLNDIKNLITTNGGQVSSAVMRAKTYGKTATQDIRVRFAGFDWYAVYLSNDRSGNPTLTLFMSDTVQEKFSGRSQTEGTYYGFITTPYGTMMCSDWSRDWMGTKSYDQTYPSGIYGLSYIRAVALNNGGKQSTSSTTTTSNSKSSSHVFARLTATNVYKNVTKFITKPAQMAWQETESATPSTAANFTNICPNDAYGIPSAGSWCENGSSPSLAQSKLNYDAWKDDFLWIPSIAEIGGYYDGYNGFWNLSINQRMSGNREETENVYSTYGLPGSSTSNSENHLRFCYWTRSSGDGDARYSYCMKPTGNLTNYRTVHESCAVRPALHINLQTIEDELNNRGDFWTSEGNYRTNNWKGEGTRNNPYLIENARDLARLSYLIYNDATTDKDYFHLIDTGEVSTSCVLYYIGKYFKQTCNIDLSAHYWQPIGVYYNRNGAVTNRKFAGIYDGGGFMVDGVYTPNGYSNGDSRQGLFGSTTGASYDNRCIIRNVTIGPNSVIAGSFSVAGICADPYYNTSLINCTNYAKVTGTYDTVAGIAGGTNSGIIIENCVNRGNIYSIDEQAAGIVGYVKDEHNLGSTITRCQNYGQIKGQKKYVGGIVGSAKSAVFRNCENYGEVINPGNITGGIAGIAEYSTLYSCANMGRVKGDGYEVAGIAGRFSGSLIYDAYNTGEITTKYCSTAQAAAGGITGSIINGARIFNAYNTGSVLGTGTGTGCVIGGISGNTGDKSGFLYNCINVGLVSCATTTYTGSIVGFANSGATYKCYYLEGKAPKSYGNTGSSSPLSAIQITELEIDTSMKYKGWFTNSSKWNSTYLWDFENTWTISRGYNNGYPVFKSSIHTLSFDTNGGDMIDSVTAYYTEKVTLPTPTRDGYTFAGWVETKDIFLESIKFARVFYHDNQFGTVMFDSSEEVERSNSKLKYSILRDIDRLSSDGYNFYLEYDNTPGYNYWHQDLNPLDEFVEYTPSGSVVTGYRAISTSWTDLYWGGLSRYGEDKEYIHCTYLDGSVGHANWYYALGVYDVYYGGIPANDVDLVTGLPVSLWLEINNLDNVTQDVGFKSGEIFYMKNGDTTLTALWRPNTYNILFNSNGGTGLMENQEVLYDVSTQLARNNFSKAGYNFVGWATSKADADASVIAYHNQDEVLRLSAVPNGFVALYAIWSPISYTVAFDGNGGLGTMTNQIFTYDSAQNLSANNFNKVGYAFAGWATSQSDAENGIITYLDGELVDNLTTSSTENYTLYAVWKLNYLAHFSTQGYWYIEIGSLPQTRVNQSLNQTLNNAKSTNSLKLTQSGNTYKLSNDISLVGYMYNGVEYCVYNNQWYIVEPIRWRLQGEYIKGQIATGGVSALLDKIVYVGTYSSGTTEYSMDSVDAFYYDLISNGNISNNLMMFTPAGLSGFDNKVFVASETEIHSIAGSFDVEFSDLVCDMLNMRYYYTRTVGSDSNMKVYNFLGTPSQSFPTNVFGIRFIVKVSDFVCV